MSQLPKIKFDMDQNMAGLVVGAFANMIGSILEAYRDDQMEKIGGKPCLMLRHGGHVTLEEMEHVIVHKIQIMANLSTAFKIPQWNEIAWMCQESAIRWGALSDVPDSNPLKNEIRGTPGTPGDGAGKATP